MICNKCDRRQNGICTKYDERLILEDILEDVVIFEKVKECKNE